MTDTGKVAQAGEFKPSVFGFCFCSVFTFATFLLTFFWLLLKSHLLCSSVATSDCLSARLTVHPWMD